MRYLFPLVAVAGLALGAATDAKAQFSLSVGNPYGGGLYIGNRVGYSNGYGIAPVAPLVSGYRSGYYGVAPVAPLVSGYSSGYYGVAPVAPLVSGYSSGYYGVAPAYGLGVPAVPLYGGYGYPRAYGYGGGYPAYGYMNRGFVGRRYRW